MVKFILIVAIILVLSSIFSFAGIGDFLSSSTSNISDVAPYLTVPLQTIANCISFLISLPFVVKFLGIIFVCILIKWASSAFGAFGGD